MLTIHDRPFPPVDRSEAGHWEDDLIIGDNHLSAIGTLVERQTRMLRLVRLPRADSDSLHAALVARTNGLLRDYFPKGVTLADHSPGHLKAVEEELNNRPRIVLQDRCPAYLFTALLASPGPSVLRR